MGGRKVVGKCIVVVEVDNQLRVVVKSEVTNYNSESEITVAEE